MHRLTFISALAVLSWPAAAAAAETRRTRAAEVTGTWVTKLEAGDLPAHPPPELQAGKREIVIEELEGGDAGSFLAIHHPTDGVLVEPGLTVDGDVLEPDDEECAEMTGYAFYDNEYRRELSGSRLTLTTVKTDCPDRVAETILTSRS